MKKNTEKKLTQEDYNQEIIRSKAQGFAGKTSFASFFTLALATIGVAIGLTFVVSVGAALLSLAGGALGSVLGGLAIGGASYYAYSKINKRSARSIFSKKDIKTDGIINRRKEILKNDISKGLYKKENLYNKYFTTLFNGDSAERYNSLLLLKIELHKDTELINNLMFVYKNDMSKQLERPEQITSEELNKFSNELIKISSKIRRDNNTLNKAVFIEEVAKTAKDVSEKLKFYEQKYPELKIDGHTIYTMPSENFKSKTYLESLEDVNPNGRMVARDKLLIAETIERKDISSIAKRGYGIFTFPKSRTLFDEPILEEHISENFAKISVLGFQKNATLLGKIAYVGNHELTKQLRTFERLDSRILANLESEFKKVYIYLKENKCETKASIVGNLLTQTSDIRKGLALLEKESNTKKRLYSADLLQPEHILSIKEKYSPSRKRKLDFEKTSDIFPRKDNYTDTSVARNLSTVNTKRNIENIPSL